LSSFHLSSTQYHWNSKCIINIKWISQTFFLFNSAPQVLLLCASPMFALIQCFLSLIFFNFIVATFYSHKIIYFFASLFILLWTYSLYDLVIKNYYDFFFLIVFHATLPHNCWLFQNYSHECKDFNAHKVCDFTAQQVERDWREVGWSLKY
jgi:hypothetical protein